MITITKLQVNTVTNNLVISATDNTDSYKFSKIMIDSSNTFNCKSEESTKAVSIQIDDIEENSDLVDYKIPFNDIYNVENPESDLFFVWVYADDYKDYLGYLYGEAIYFTDGHDNYYYVTNGEDPFSGEIHESTEAAYKTAKQAAETYIMKSYRDDTKLYIKYYTESVMKYYMISNSETTFTEITEEEYNDSRKTQVPYPAFGLTLSVKDFYNLLLNNIEIQTKDSTHCNPSCSDVNFMLAWQGFNLAKTLQDYNQMIYYWKILHGFNNTSSYTSCCNK